MCSFKYLRWGIVMRICEVEVILQLWNELIRTRRQDTWHQASLELPDMIFRNEELSLHEHHIAD